MDREIPKEVRQKERNKKIIRYSSIGVAMYYCHWCTYICTKGRSGGKGSCLFHSRYRSD